MSKIYLELDQTTGRFFEYSKEPKEGYEKNESATGKVSYRKVYTQGAIGKLKFINENEEDFGKGKFKTASLVLEDKDKNQVTMKLPVLTAKGSLNEYFEQLATYLPNMKIGETYRVFPYSMEVEYDAQDGTKKKTTNKGFSISTYDIDNDVKLVKVERAHNFGKEGDIPAIVWEKVVDMGETKNIKNDRDRKNFLYEIFKGTVTKTQGAAPTSAPQSAPAPKAQEGFKDEEDHDDLPF